MVFCLISAYAQKMHGVTRSVFFQAVRRNRRSAILGISHIRLRLFCSHALTYFEKPAGGDRYTGEPAGQLVIGHMLMRTNMNTGNLEIEKWKPGVPKATLLLVAGITWMGIGSMLNGLSYLWLRNEKPENALLAVFFGFACALVIHHFGFLRLVDRNLGRILPMEGRRCLFSFIPWKSYILIFIMILIGFFLRHSPIPKWYLAILYTGIGTALILSSLRYLRHVILAIKSK